MNGDFFYLTLLTSALFLFQAQLCPQLLDRADRRRAGEILAHVGFAGCREGLKGGCVV